MRKIFVLFLLMIGLAAQSVWADVPGTINYQGRLTDADGNAVGDGTYGVTFTLYFQETGNTPTGWSENQNVAVNNGYFNIALGSNNSLSSLSFDTTYYLETWVSGDAQAMSPRQKFNSVPYAMNVADNSVNSSKIIDGTITGSDIATNNSIWGASQIAAKSITGGNLADATINSGNIADGAVTQAKAPWAPTVLNGVNNPKIGGGYGKTDASGNTTVNIF